VRETVVKRAWNEHYKNHNNLLPLFDTHSAPVDLSTLHPEPVQIFKLWQIYVDNVNPMFKVTHNPSLQGRIIEAASNVRNINPTFNALLFGIYCMSVISLPNVQETLGASREELLTMYQYGCQQALQQSMFLRSLDIDCLTALFFYLVCALYKATVYR
jgi:hypothetical protein